MFKVGDLAIYQPDLELFPEEECLVGNVVEVIRSHEAFDTDDSDMYFVRFPDGDIIDVSLEELKPYLSVVK